MNSVTTALLPMAHPRFDRAAVYGPRLTIYGNHCFRPADAAGEFMGPTWVWKRLILSVASRSSSSASLRPHSVCSCKDLSSSSSDLRRELCRSAIATCSFSSLFRCVLSSSCTRRSFKKKTRAWSTDPSGSIGYAPVHTCSEQSSTDLNLNMFLLSCRL